MLHHLKLSVGLVFLFGQALPNPGPKKPDPRTAAIHALPWSDSVHIPEQGWFDRLIHGEKRFTAPLAFPAGRTCGDKINAPLFIVDTLEGEQADREIMLDPWGWGEAKDKPRGMGVDVTAPAGRTIFVRWGCSVV